MATASYYGQNAQGLDRRSFQKEKEADLYGAVFLVPKWQLLQERAGISIFSRHKDGGSMSSSALWKRIYTLARSFLVSPSMMRRCLLELGWLEVCEDKRGDKAGLKIAGVE